MYLLDVNLLIALFDPAHPNHEEAHQWFRTRRKRGWATCPLTINGFVRVVSSPAYPTIEASPAEAVSRLRAFCAGADHHFWPDDLSLLDETRFRPALLQGPQQLTDVYLVALAVRNGGRLATFDRTIPWKAVAGAEARHLEALGMRPV